MNTSYKNSPYFYGILMLAGFFAYFFIMKFLGLYTEVGLRFFNVLIHGGFIYLAMKAYRQNKSERLDWANTVMVGIKASAVAVIGFAAYQFIYLKFWDPAFMAHIQENALMGEFLTPLNSSLFLLAEGVGVSVFFSYLGMRYVEYREALQADLQKGLSMRSQVSWRDSETEGQH